MAKYVVLINWTEQGIQNFGDTVDRFESASKLAADMGGSLQAYWTVGECDIVAVSEFPDDETATAFLLKVGSLGNLRTRTMRAFDADEMRRIIGAASG